LLPSGNEAAFEKNLSLPLTRNTFESGTRVIISSGTSIRGCVVGVAVEEVGVAVEEVGVAVEEVGVAVEEVGVAVEEVVVSDTSEGDVEGPGDAVGDDSWEEVSGSGIGDGEADVTGAVVGSDSLTAVGNDSSVTVTLSTEQDAAITMHKIVNL